MSLAQPKARQKREISMMHVVSHRIWLKCIVYPLSYQKIPFNALVFTLRSKVDLIWMRAIRPVKAQSVQFSKNAKKLNTDLCQFFLFERKHCPCHNLEIKNGGHCTRFCGRAANVRTKCISSDFWKEWGNFDGRGKRALKNLFLQNLHRGSPWGRQTEQHRYCLHYAHSQHIESRLSKKQRQATIPIAFLFSELHFNNVTSDISLSRLPSCYAS